MSDAPVQPASTPASSTPHPAWGLAAALTLVAAVTLGVRFAPLSTWGRALIERAVNGVEIGRLGRLQVEGLTGDVWADFSVRRLALVDSAGPWLDIRDLHMAWRPSMLWERRLEILSLDSPNVSALRDPRLAKEEAGANGRLPVALQIDRLAARVTLEPALATRRGVYDVRGAGLVDRSGAARGALAAVSLLHAGDYLSARFDVGHRNKLALDVRGREARGGALAGLMGLAADQPFTVDLHALGKDKVGRFSLVAQVGASRPAEAAGSWDALGARAEGRFTLAASKRLASYQAMIGPEAKFALTATAIKGGLYAGALNVWGRNMTLSARGNVDADHRRTDARGVALDARFADTSSVLGWPALGAGEFKGDLTGNPDRWILAGSANVAHVVLGDYVIAQASGPVRLESKASELTLQTNVRGQGGAGRDLLAAVLGANPTGSTEIAWLSNGHTLIRKLTVVGVGGKINAQGDQGLFGGLSFKGDAVFNRLDLIHAGARGQVTARWSASEGGGQDHWGFSFDAKGQDVSTGSVDTDPYLGRTPGLAVQGDYAHGAVSVIHSTLTGAAGALGAAGQIGADGALKLSLDWRAEGPLALGPLDITGAARGTGALTGKLDAPRADLMADFKGVDLPYLPLENAHMILSFFSEPSGANGHFILTGSSGYGPAKAAAGFRMVDDGLDISDLDIDAGGVIARGVVSLRDETPTAADLAITVGAGTFLDRGHASGKLRIFAETGGSRAALSLTAQDAVLRGGDNTISALAVSADGPLSHLNYVAKGSGVLGENPWKLAGTGLFERAEGGGTMSFSGAGRFMRADFKTNLPAQIVLKNKEMDANLHLSVGGGKADVIVLQNGDGFKANAALSSLSLALFDPDYLGRFDGNLALAGRGASLSGSLDAHLNGVGGRDMKGSPPLDGSLKATLGGSVISVVADMGNAQGARAHVDMDLPAQLSAAPLSIALDSHRPMSGRFAIDGEVRPLWDLTMGGGRSLAGRLRASGTLQGTVSDPRAIGTASLENGRFQDIDTGLTLDGVTLAATLRDDAIDVSQFSARDAGKGVLTGSGVVSLARQGDSSFRLDLRGFRLIDNDVGQASATGLVTVNRAADGKVQLTGDLKIDHAQLAPNPPVPSGVVPMDVVEINKPVDVDEPLPAVNDRKSPIDLNVSLKAPGGVFIKGRGLNVELSLDAKVTGTTDNPQLSGVAHVVRGDYDFAGRRFEFDDRGVVHLGSTPETIRLDLTASRDDPTLTAVIRITGTAAKPTVVLSSTPVLPKDEILSQVLFGASATQLSGLQAAQLASAVSSLAGGGGFDLIGGLRNLAHLDRLAVSGDAATGTSVAGGKYLTDKVYLEISGGGREGPGAQVEWRVRRHLAIISKVTSQGDSQISVRWRKN